MSKNNVFILYPYTRNSSKLGFFKAPPILAIFSFKVQNCGGFQLFIFVSLEILSSVHSHIALFWREIWNLKCQKYFLNTFFPLYGINSLQLCSNIKIYYSSNKNKSFIVLPMQCISFGIKEQTTHRPFFSCLLLSSDLGYNRLTQKNNKSSWWSNWNGKNSFFNWNIQTSVFLDWNQNIVKHKK